MAKKTTTPANRGREYPLSFTIAELLELEEWMQAAWNDRPECQAAIDSACYKLGLALERPWALKKRDEGSAAA